MSFLASLFVVGIGYSQRYILDTTSATWDGSENLCLFRYDTHLASIHDISQLIEANNTINAGSVQQAYIGLTDKDIEGTWKWIDGTPWDYGQQFNQLPWIYYAPDDYNNGNPGEDCNTIKNNGLWDDYACDGYYDPNTYLLTGLCRYPQPTQIINDKYDGGKRILSQGYIAGTIDILDEIYIEFHIIFKSWPNTWGSILLFGNNQSQRLPAIFVYGSTTISSSFDIVNNANPKHDYEPVGGLTLDTTYHYMLRQTQTHLNIQIDGNTVYNGATKSHAIMMNRNVYLSDPYYDTFNAEISNLYVTTSNMHAPNMFNYNCDGTNRWEIIGGSWDINDTACTITATSASETVPVVWMGGYDASSLNWTDYKIEVKLTVHSGNHAGILLRSETISPNNDMGQQYWFGIHFQYFDNVGMGKFNDSFTFLGGANPNIQYGVEYTMRVEIKGNIFNVYWNNEFLFTVTDNSYSKGSVGLRTWTASATFSSVIITFPSTDNTLLTIQPTTSPTTTVNPTKAPTNNPTPAPTAVPTPAPTDHPTPAPTDHPTPSPTDVPTPSPTDHPTPSPTDFPTPSPTNNPTPSPTDNPTAAQTTIAATTTSTITSTSSVSISSTSTTTKSTTTTSTTTSTTKQPTSTSIQRTSTTLNAGNNGGSVEEETSTTRTRSTSATNGAANASETVLTSDYMLLVYIAIIVLLAICAVCILCMMFRMKRKFKKKGDTVAVQLADISCTNPTTPNETNTRMINQSAMSIRTNSMISTSSNPMNITRSSSTMNTNGESLQNTPQRQQPPIAPPTPPTVHMNNMNMMAPNINNMMEMNPMNMNMMMTMNMNMMAMNPQNMNMMNTMDNTMNYGEANKPKMEGYGHQAMTSQVILNVPLPNEDQEHDEENDKNDENRNIGSFAQQLNEKVKSASNDDEDSSDDDNFYTKGGGNNNTVR